MRVVVGMLLAASGCFSIARYTWMNARARARGSAAHWRIGWLIGGPGMIAMAAGWGLLAAYRPGLHTGGIYALVRHPQALSLILLAVGSACASGSVPFFLSLPAWVGFWISYTYLEERNELLPAFGDEYRHYIRSTPRVLPRMRSLSSTRRRTDAPQLPGAR